MLLKDTTIVIGSTVFILLFGMLSSYIASNAPRDSQEFFGSWSCTADLQVCPDGSTVTRTPPYCQFAACPHT